MYFFGKSIETWRVIRKGFWYGKAFEYQIFSFWVEFRFQTPNLRYLESNSNGNIESETDLVSAWKRGMPTVKW